MKTGWFLLLSWGCGPQGSEPRGRPDGPPGPRDTGDEPDDGLVVGELGPSPWADDPPKMAEPVPGRPWQGKMDAKEADGVILQGGGRGEGTSSLGKYIGVLPDVTGDDVPELAFHHTVPDGTRRNYIHLYSGVTDSTTLRAPPAAAIRNQGWRDIFLPTLYGNVGDVDGDGFDDLLIGTTSTGWHGYLDLPQSGSAYIVPGPVTGKASLRDIQTGFLFSSALGITAIGTSVAALGDQDGDGHDDFALGSGIPELFATGAAPITQSKAWIVHGPVNGGFPLEQISTAVVEVDAGHQPRAGARVAPAGDQNGDGIIDLAIGSRLLPMEDAAAGAVLIFHGPMSGSLRWQDADAVVFDPGGSASYSDLGYSLAADVDTNGDGNPDLWVGDAYDAAYLVPGPLDGPVRIVDSQEASLVEGGYGHGLGSSIAALRDVDGDGKEDVAIACWNHYQPVAGIGDGEIIIMYGGVSGAHEDQPGLVSDPDVAYLHGDQYSSLFGYSIDGGHDLDQDGWPDLAIGHPYYEDPELPGDYVGRIFVLWGGLR